MLGKVLALSSLAAFVLLSALMQSVSPASMHPLGILFVFVLIYVLASGVLTFFVFVLSKTLRKLARRPYQRQHVTLKRSYIYGSVLALAPVLILGMRSIGRAGVYEVVLVVTFEVIACLYIAKQRSL